MELLKVILLAIGLFGVGILGMAIKILLKKGGKFPNSHVSGNSHLKREGVYCAQTQDKVAQRSVWKKVSFKKLSVVPDVNGSK